MLRVLTATSGWMPPPGRRCLFSVQHPEVARPRAWYNLYPGKGNIKRHTSSYMRLIQSSGVTVWVCANCKRRYKKVTRWHLVQGHAEGADEAAIVVLQSNGGG